MQTRISQPNQLFGVQTQRQGSAHPQQGRKPSLHRQAPAPQFSGMLNNVKLAAGSRLVSLFKNIDEKFIVQFLALDVIGMWIPRIKVSLERGRDKYDVSQDPSMQGQPLSVQLKHSLIKNIKGLNWTNFAEEAGREFATGPGMLIIPSLMYAMARKRFAKTAVMMPYGDLIKLTDGFKAHLKNTPSGQALDNLPPLNATYAQQLRERLGEAAPLLNSQQALRAEFDLALRREIAQYLRSILAADETMNNVKIADLIRSVNSHLSDAEFHQQKDALAARLREHLSDTSGADRTLGQYMDDWTDRWSKALFNGEQDIAQRLEDELSELVTKYYKQSYVLEQNQAVSKTLTGKAFTDKLQELKLLGKSDKVRLSTGEAPLGDLFANVHKWQDYVKQVAETRLSQPNGKLTEVAESMLNKLVRKKGILSACTAILSGMYLVVLAQIMQRHEEYPGERPSGSHAGRQTTGNSHQTAARHTQPVSVGGFNS